MPHAPILKITNLSKAFGPVQALCGVEFELERGEIHAIAGENGAGKSTLMKVIDGILRPDAGQILFDGRPVQIGSPAEAQRLGIGFVHQEIALCPDVTVAENMFMAATNTSGALLMDYRDLTRRSAGILRRLGDIDPSAPVRTLSLSQQQLVEIAKALTLDCRVLILDEPTAALTEREAKALFEIMHGLARQGIGIIYISHRMAEIFDNCDRVTVLRDGRYVTTRAVAETTPAEVVGAMVGRVLDSLYPPKMSEDEAAGDIILEVRGLGDGRRFRDISFQLRKGEILGFGGLIGAGRSEIVRGICGLEGPVTGDIRLEGRPLAITHYRDSIDAGMVYLSEDRKTEGLFLAMSIAANVSALAVEDVASRIGIIDDDKEAARAEHLGQRLGVRYAHVHQPVAALSGGNQQKVAIAKMLAVEPRIVFLDEPTRGVDVGAKAEIHRILRDLARGGVGVVVISSELPELIGICDRVLVVREGRISGEVSGEAMTEQRIMVLASIADDAPRAS